jgi:hypothetical protein
MIEGQPERRRHPRFPLGVPVRVHMSGADKPTTIELVEVSQGGSSFRTPEPPELGLTGAFGFVTPDLSVCLARGRVVRVDGQGFAMAFDRMNGAFRSFLGDVSGRVVIAA